MFLRNCWYAVGWSRDFATDGPYAARLLGEMLVLYRTPNGALVAQEDRCPHRLAPLSQGRVEGENLRCMYHGLLFAPDGRCVKIPGQEHIPPSVRTRTYPVLERHSIAWIWMGEAALADPALIPDFVGVDDPAWTMRPGRMDYAASYELINDNLLDLSHIAWVHQASFGGGDAATNEKWAETPVHVRGLERGVHVRRWATNAPMPPFTRHLAGDFGDLLVSYDFIVPGIFLLKSRAYPLGTAEACAFGEPEVQPVQARFTCQAVTPLSEQESCYFFAFGPWSRDSEHEPGFYETGIKAFQEDRTMIEGQQKVIDADPLRRMQPLAMDGATTRFRGIMSRLMREEVARAVEAA